MATAPRYCPCVKAKAGEMKALRECPDDILNAMLPIVDIPRGQKEVEEPAVLRTHIDKAVRQIRNTFGGGRQLITDLFDLRLDLRLPGAVHPLAHVLRSLISAGVVPIPCTGLDRDQAYQDVMHWAVSTCGRGAALRLLWEDIETPTLTNAMVAETLTEINVGLADTDLLLDLRNIYGRDPDEVSATVTHALGGLHDIASFRRVILTGHSIPQSIAQAVPVGQEANIARLEWGVWRAVVAQPNLPRHPLYGDYGIVPPDYSDVSVEIMSSVMAPKVRYTADTFWFVARGHSFKGHPDGYDQYYTLADRLITLHEYCGADYSYGDRLITRKAERQDTAGSPAQWVTIDSNHHYCFVVRQIAGV